MLTYKYRLDKWDATLQVSSVAIVMINKAILVLFVLLVVYMVKGDPGTIVRYRHHVVPVSRYIYSHYHDYHDHHDHIDHLHYPHYDHYHEHHW